MDPRASLDVMVKRKNPCPYWESNPSHPACSLVKVPNTINVTFQKGIKNV